MTDLHDKLLKQGYTKEQVEKILLTIYNYLKEKYPVLFSVCEKHFKPYLNNRDRPSSA